jgi:hypothetical protein
MITVRQPMIIAHNTSKQTQLTTKLTKQSRLQVRTNIFPGKQLDAISRGQMEPEVEQAMYMHISIVIPTKA